MVGLNYQNLPVDKLVSTVEMIMFQVLLDAGAIGFNIPSAVHQQGTSDDYVFNVKAGTYIRKMCLLSIDRVPLFRTIFAKRPKPQRGHWELVDSIYTFEVVH